MFSLIWYQVVQSRIGLSLQRGTVFDLGTKVVLLQGLGSLGSRSAWGAAFFASEAAQAQHAFLSIDIYNPTSPWGQVV